ncbi:MAG: hypothetical protein ACOX0A_01570 [Thermoguttaceae bacterium]|jgi:hypothetical protein
MRPEEDRNFERYSFEPNRRSDLRARHMHDDPNFSNYIEEDDYVDWNQCERFALSSNEGRRKIYVFATPFIIAFILFFLFDRLLKQESAVNPMPQKEIAALQASDDMEQERLKLVPNFSQDNDETLASVADFNDEPNDFLEDNSYLLPSESNKLPFNNDSIFDNNIIQSKDQPDGDAEEIAFDENGATSRQETLNPDETPIVEATSAHDRQIAIEEPEEIDSANDIDDSIDLVDAEDVTIANHDEPRHEVDVSGESEIFPELDNDQFPMLSGDVTLEQDEEPIDEEPVVDLEQARAELAQLEYQFNQIKDDDPRNVDAVLEALDAPLAELEEFVSTAPQELADSSTALLTSIKEFQSDLQDNIDFYRRLEMLDVASVDAEQTRDFFAPWRADLRSPDAVDNDSIRSGAANDYEQEFARAAQSLQALEVVDKWNAFMQENGERLERFQTSSEDAKIGLTFISEIEAQPGAPDELKVLKKREAQWRYDSENNFPTYRKVFLMLDKELNQRYWTYTPSRDLFYYLPNPPHAGENIYVANAQGKRGTVTIPADAPELSQEISPQKRFIIELQEDVEQIPDSLRSEDVAQWYAKWSAFLEKIQMTEDLDPILQYKFARETAQYLRSSDFYFALRIEQLLKVLNAPQLDATGIDRFQTETPEIRSLRTLAVSRVDFLPKNHLDVGKTTADLDASVGRFATLYRRVGWLDKNFNGEWRLRRPEDSEIPSGNLYVLNVDPQENEPRWFKIGVSDGSQVVLNIASNSIPRGSIVLCRIPLVKGSSVASQSSVDALFNR